MKKQLLTLLVLLILPLVASADGVEIDGIYYNLITKGNVAEVTENPNKYIGAIVIPESVKYNDVNYSVINISWGRTPYIMGTYIMGTYPLIQRLFRC